MESHPLSSEEKGEGESSEATKAASEDPAKEHFSPETAAVDGEDSPGSKEVQCACLDCGKPLTDERFCPNCGQKSDPRKLSLWDFIYETLGSFFAFDSRWWATLRVLISQPGKLAREYSDGRRTRYTPPLRVFLWSLIVTLLIEDSRFVVEPQMREGTRGFVDGIQGGDSLEIKVNSDTLELPDHALANPDLDPSIGLKRIGAEDSWRNRKAYAFFQNLQKQGGSGFSDFVREHFILMLLLFVPFLSLWLKLLYLRKGIFFLEHATFVFYAHSLLFILICISEIALLLSGFDLMNVLFWFYLAHLYLSFVGFYGESYLKSAFKMALSSLGFVILVILFVIGGLVASAISMSL